MYSNIKQFILKIIPKQILFQYEYPLRYLFYLQHRGNSFQCNICNKNLSGFIQIANDRLCPRCGSIQRNRRLWKILKEEFLHENIKILDFSPSRSLHRVMKKGNYFYVSSDLSGDFLSEVSYDITHINSNAESFHLVICYHILEHIGDDIKAIQELNRVLKANGKCIIQTPFKEGEILEDTSIRLPTDREKFFGQADHVRIYSVDGLKSRLEQVGFRVEVRNFKNDFQNYHGYSANETVLICSKP